MDQAVGKTKRHAFGMSHADGLLCTVAYTLGRRIFAETMTDNWQTLLLAGTPAVRPWS
jgi:hypothetical protein